MCAVNVKNFITYDEFITTYWANSSIPRTTITGNFFVYFNLKTVDTYRRLWTILTFEFMN